MDFARVFVVTPTEHKDLLLSQDTIAKFKQAGLLPGRFVLAHLTLLEPELLVINSRFDPN